ncbi:MAG TPA: 50S ribosomal protein L21 [Anaerolineae bacterium]|nr:50S ribosomal protein L21 [Anaerolineae bacterium]
MKYAVLESGGKQYIAREGETIEVDRLQVEIGEAIDFKDVLLLVDNAKVHVGTPFVKGAKVRGNVVEQFRTKKIIVFKYIPKERYRRKRGHRQSYTRVAIDKITLTTPRKKATTADADEKSEVKKPARKPTTTEKTQASKPTTTKKSTATKTTAESKGKTAPAKSTGKTRSPKASTGTKGKTQDTE